MSNNAHNGRVVSTCINVDMWCPLRM